MLRSVSQADRYWGKIIHWRWWLAAAIIGFGAFLAVWFLYRMVMVNWLEIISPLIILTLGVLLSLLVVVTLSWLKTRLVYRDMVRENNLHHELRQKLLAAQNWDEFATSLFEFLHSQLPLSGVSLLIHDRAENKDERVAEHNLNEREEPPWLGLKLVLGEQPVGQLKVQIATKELFLPKHYDFLKGILPEVSLAADRARLMLPNWGASTSKDNNWKTKIGRYLHDTLGHDLAYLFLKLENLEKETEFKNNARMKSELQHLRDVADQAYIQLRIILDELLVGISTDFAESLQECITLVESRASFHVDYKCDGKPRKLANHVQQQILYIVREILRNVEKHTHARQVTLNLIWSETGLTIESANDGQGFDVATARKVPGHHGLKIIQDIVDELKGRLEINSSVGNGTKITLWIPY